MPTRQGSFKLFRLFGVDVYLHWMWFVYGAIRITSREGNYSSLGWNVAEYLTLFLIVLIHEFGHALACRSVGGKANLIVLWLFGGVAYVSPPQRPGATLWSIAAGPLVNVALIPIFTGLRILTHSMNWHEPWPSVDMQLSNLQMFLWIIWLMNFILLIFNMLPIYPLDGGQILRSLLWFPFGRARSLMAVTIIGFIGVAGLITLAIWLRAPLFGLMCFFILTNCWGGLMQARALAKIAAAPRREGFACPECKLPPPCGEFWVCSKCRTAFDTFVTQAVCPKCGEQFAKTGCVECGALRPLTEWALPPVVPPPIQ